MAGRCPWTGRCGYATHADAYHKKNYCNDAVRCEKCPQRPMNYGDKNVQTNYNNKRSVDETVSFGQVLFVLFIGVPFVLWILSKIGIFIGIF